jgi:uncharacterized oligopeptide transporter (OPT) family protein
VSAAAEPPAGGAPGAGRRELTLRAVLVGCGIGVVLAAGNVYTALKTGFIDGGSISAAILGFTFFAIFRSRRGACRPYSALENNITQTTAASAAIMGFVLGVGGPFSALSLMGRSYPAWQMCVWAIALGTLGTVVAAALRTKLILKEALPFPTGAATAEVIETIYTTRESALHRARLLVMSGVAAMYLTWFRDGPWSLVPPLLVLPVTLSGVSGATLTLGISLSPLLASTGIFMGLRGAASMLLGGGITWLVLAPWVVRSGIVQTATYGSFVSWLVWPGLGLMMSSTFVPLALEWRSALRSFKDLTSLVRDDRGAGDRSSARVPLQGAIVAGCVAAVVWIGRAAFGLHPAITLIALLLSAVLAGVCARAAGETDIAPVGSMGMLMQLVFGAYGPIASLVSGAVAQGSGSQVAQTLWAFKAGHRLAASPRAQLCAQMIGAVVGGLVVVPVYVVIVRAYGIGTEAMPAATALSWKATADAVGGGLAAMPHYGPLAGAIGFTFGIALSLLGRTRLGRLVPSPTAVGIAVLTPASLTAMVFVGAVGASLVRRRWPALSETTLTSMAAGGIAGESLMGVMIAALVAAGLL